MFKSYPDQDIPFPLRVLTQVQSCLHQLASGTAGGLQTGHWEPGDWERSRDLERPLEPETSNSGGGLGTAGRLRLGTALAGGLQTAAAGPRPRRRAKVNGSSCTLAA